MRSRMGFAGVAVAAVSLIVGVGAALAASHHKHHPKAANPRSVFVHCSGTQTLVAPRGQPAVDQPNSGGDGYGPATCSPTAFGTGSRWFRFTIPDSGDMVGKYTDYYDGGTLSGTFDLEPQESPPLTSDTFYSESFSGKVLVTGGTAVYKGVKSKNSKGTMSCNSPDSVHFSCTQKMSVLIPPPATSSTSG